MHLRHLLLAGLLVAAGSALVANPQYVNYQGTLNDANGDPLPTGDYTMEFRIHRDFMADSLIWGPFHYDGTNGPGHSAMVHLTNGRFNVILGPADTAGRAIGAAFAEDPASPDQRFVEIRVNGGDPILPRQQILTVPYSFEAQNARTLNHVAPVQYLNPPGMMAPFAGPAANAPDGWLVCDGAEYPATGYPALYAAIGTAWGGRIEDVGGVNHYYFRVPDMRGMFLRGVNGDRDDAYSEPGTGPGREVGSLQAHSLKTHSHQWARMVGSGRNGEVFSWTEANNPAEVKVLDARWGDEAGWSGDDDWFNVEVTSNVYTNPASTIPSTIPGTVGETRPNNAAVHFIIKF